MTASVGDILEKQERDGKKVVVRSVDELQKRFSEGVVLSFAVRV